MEPYTIYIFDNLQKKVEKSDREIIALYAILYSVVRFFVEDLRTDSLMLGSLCIAQVVSLILLFLDVVIFYIRRTKNKVNSRSDSYE